MSRSRKIILSAMISTIIVITGCGQKGSLYFPGQKEANQQPTNSSAKKAAMQPIAQNIT